MFDLVDKINTFLSEPSAARAVAFGLALSWGGTQIIKKRGPKPLRLWLLMLDDVDTRLVLRTLAFALAWVPVFLLWPAPSIVERTLAAGVTAVCAPTAYTLIARIAYHYFPWLEPKVSSNATAPKE
jgi:hypothetical protein